MKKFLVGVLFLSTLVSCGKKAEKQIASLELTGDSLQMVLAERDSILNGALYALSDISSTLNEIKIQEGMVVASAELGKSDEATIKEDLQVLAQRLKDKRKVIANLESSTSKLKAANVRIDGLTKLIDELNIQLEQRDKTITGMLANISDLKAEVARLNQDLSVVTTTNEQMGRQIDDQTTELNTAYYIVGQEKALLEAGILVKKGTINRTLVINSDINKSLLTKIDIRSVDRIEVKGKKVDIIGGFPTSTYELQEGDGRQLVEAVVIKNKTEFWANGRILVIAYK